jgi:hypothetical protein
MIMKQTIRSLAIIAVSLGLAGIAAAHHSAVQFDFGKQVKYTGTVKEFSAINPHMRMTVEMKDAKGARTVKFEGHSTNNMYRNGYRKGMVNVGDTITVTAAPYRDGTEGGYVISAEMANGQFFGMRSTRGQDAQRVAEETRKLAEGR